MRPSPCDLLLLVATLVATLALMGACDDTTTAPSLLPADCEVAPTITSLEQTYFKGSCAFPSCHGADKQEAGLLLTEGQAFESLVNVDAKLPGAAVDGLIRVVPGDPDASYLVQKVEGPGEGHGTMMPPGVTEPLDPACRIAALRAWIAAGANP